MHRVLVKAFRISFCLWIIVSISFGIGYCMLHFPIITGSILLFVVAPLVVAALDEL